MATKKNAPAAATGATKKAGRPAAKSAGRAGKASAGTGKAAGTANAAAAVRVAKRNEENLAALAGQDAVPAPTAAGGGVVTSFTGQVPESWLRPYELPGGEAMNPRSVFDDESLAGLRKSLETEGQDIPMLVHVPADSPPVSEWTEESRPDLQIVDGERRWRSVRGTGFVLRAEFRTYSPVEALRTARIVGTERENLSQLDIARAWQREMAMLEMGPVEYAEIAGVPQPTISNAVRLLRLPVRIQSLINAGHVSPSAARDHLLPFADLREDLAPVVFGDIAQRIEDEVDGDPDVVLKKSRVHMIAASIAARMSHPVRAGTGAGHDAQPVFDVAEHDACGCGGPEYHYHEHAGRHSRCFDATWYDAANTRARAAKRAEQERKLAEQQAQARRDVEAAAAAAPAPAATQDDEPAGQAGTQGVGSPETSRGGAALPAAAPLRETASDPFGPGSGMIGGRPTVTVAPTPTPPAPAPLPPYEPGQVLTYEQMRAYDPARTWMSLGLIGAAGVVATAGAPQPEVVPGASIRYVETGDSTGDVSVYCADAAAVAIGREGAAARVKEFEVRAGREIAEEMRRESSTQDVSAPGTLAALLAAIGRTGPAFVIEASRVIGVDLGPLMSASQTPAARIAAVLAEQPRKELEAVVRVVAMLAEADDFGRVYTAASEITKRAQSMYTDECTEALKALLATVPAPEMSDEAELARHLTALETALHRATRGASNERMGTPAADDFAERVDALRQATAAADRYLDSHELTGRYGELDELHMDAREFLDTTPDAILTLPEADRANHIIDIIGEAVRRVHEVRMGPAIVKNGNTTIPRQQLVDDAGAELTRLRAVATAVLGPDHDGAVAMVLKDADALLADLAGQSETVFGDFAGQEEETAAPAADGPDTMLANLVMKVRGAAVHADNVGLSAEDEASALALLRKRYNEADAFFRAHEVEYTVHDFATMEDVAERLRQITEVDA